MITWEVDTDTARLTEGVLHLDAKNDYTECYFLVTYEDDHNKKQTCTIPVTILEDDYRSDMQVVLGWLAGLENFNAQRLVLNCHTGEPPEVVVGGNVPSLMGYTHRYHSWEEIPESVASSIQVIQAAMTTFPGKQDVYEGL